MEAPAYSQATSPGSYRHLFFPGAIDPVDEGPGTTLLDTNVVRSLRDLWRGGSGHLSNDVESRVRRLISGPALGNVLPHFGAAERAWRRRSSTLEQAEFSEHLVACIEMLGADLRSAIASGHLAPLAARPASAAQRQLRTQVDLVTQAFASFFEYWAYTEVEPRYAVLLKVHSLLQRRGKASVAIELLEWAADELDFTPALEIVLGCVLLAPRDVLTPYGRALRAPAEGVIKPWAGAKTRRVCWGAAWDLALTRVRRQVETYAKLFEQNCPGPFTIVTADTPITKVHRAFMQTPRLGDLVEVRFDVSAGLDLYRSDQLFTPGSKLAARLESQPWERVAKAIERDGWPERKRHGDSISAQLSVLHAQFPEPT